MIESSTIDELETHQHDVLVAVGSRFCKGFGYKSDDDPTDDWNYPKNSPQNQQGVGYFVPTSLNSLIAREWKPNEHMFNHVVQYIVYDKEGKPLAKQPRIKKADGGYDRMVAMGYSVKRTVLWYDIDLPDHKSWLQVDQEVAMDQLERLNQNDPILSNAFIKLSRRGNHIVVVLNEPIDVMESLVLERKVADHLKKIGILVDPQVKDWDRLFRFPGAPMEPPFRKDKNGKDKDPEKYAQECEDVARKFIEIQSVAKVINAEWNPVDVVKFFAIDWQSEDTQAVLKSRTLSRVNPNRARLSKHYKPEESIDPLWDKHAEKIGKAIREGKQEGLHNGYLALAGFLCNMGMSEVLVPAFIGLICNHAGSKNTVTNVQGAARTVQRWIDGQSYSGDRFLAAEWTHIYQAAFEIFGGRRVKDTPPQTKPLPELKSFEEANAILSQAFTTNDGKTTLLQVTTGVGKTSQAVKETERLEQIRGPEGKIAIATDTNHMAKQVFNIMRDSGIGAARMYGPLSYTGDGECKFKKAGELIADSGQSMFATMCSGFNENPCPHFKTCKAKDRIEGPSNARANISTHAKITELASEAKSGKLLIDESVQSVIEHTFTIKDLEHAEKMLDNFARRAANALTPALVAFKAFVQSVGVLGERLSVPEAIKRSVDVIEEQEILAACKSTSTTPSRDIFDTIMECASKAIEEDKNQSTIPLRPTKSGLIRESVTFARDVARASKTLNMIRCGLDQTYASIIDVDVSGKDRIVTLSTVNRAFLDAMTRGGTTILLDATGFTQLPFLSKFVKDFNVVEIHVKDACPVRRIFHSGMGSRRGLFDDAKLPKWEGPLISHFYKIRETIDEERKKGNAIKEVALVTFMKLEAAICYAMKSRSTLEDPVETWKSHGEDFTQEALDEAAHIIRKILPDDVKYYTLHYGAERGNNFAKNVDMIVTLGDPRPNLDSTRRASRLCDHDCDQMMHDETSARLTQALGRARHASPAREGKRLVSMHIGKVLPSEPQWHMEGVELSIAPPYVFDMGMGQLVFTDMLKKSGKTHKEVAQAVGVHSYTVHRWLNGLALINKDTAAKLVEFFGVTDTPPSTAPPPS